jgi:DNA modification methylase
VLRAGIGAVSVRLIRGDCRDVLKTLPDESVHCCVTSPPYWGLRDYGVSGQLGMERSPGEYLDVVVDVFRQVRRVLRSDGTLWLNLGDSYAASPNGRKAVDIVNDDRTFRDKPFSTIGPIYDPTYEQTPRCGKTDNQGNISAAHGGRIMAGGQVKPKDLCGIPWRVAFALQADGWWLRQDIIWSKPNPMPESVTDRCTKAHEYIFLLSKSERYYYDQDAIREEPTGRTDPIRHFGSGPHAESHTRNYQLDGLVGRNKRSVWEVATAPFSEAHFATFPPALIEPCILAGCPAKCCAKCGAPWVRQVEKTRTFESGSGRSGNMPNGKNGANLQGGGNTLDIRRGPCVVSHTLGFSPSCSCNADPVPGACLDPFGGAGTTGLVADRLGRNAILIELNSDYAAMAERRITDDAPLFAQVAAE